MEEYRDLFSHLIKQSRRYEYPESNIVLSVIILDISHPLMQRRIKVLLSSFCVGGYVDAKLLLAKISINKILDELGNLGIIDKLVELGYFKK